MKHIYIDIETLRSPEAHRLQLLEEKRSNFKPPGNLTKGQAVIDLKLDPKDVKNISKDELISRWEKELSSVKAEEAANTAWEKTSFDPTVAPIACICVDVGNVKQQFDLNSYKTEAEMLTAFHSFIDAACTKNGTVILGIPQALH